ncbi:Cerato-platanin [Penicillium cf. griseofulvum]|uniref:Cerato-platanin n=1 Tax=Penicillium cf. griseofulvum TaxID=2972120 RepID=A0A9W9MPP0_9EURO|nr:Cerato-platanin [Penicillium cf. griseofulvum]KAJ5437663.1 Cerato-platanin [Penicillium cf. griseofulvum]KAJ5441793.1 Cerato-platanin [Penicillium cf. griseofulvum]
MKPTILFASAFLATFNLVAAAPAPAEAQKVSISYDPKYDVGTSSLNTVSCSNGIYGLVTQGYTDFASLPTFPNIGGAITIPGWNSPNCGKCYALHYSNGRIDKTINVLAVDAAPGGFNIGLQAMNTLTNGMAVELGRVDATYVEVEDSVCGL